MNDYEKFTLVIAAAALIVSVVALIVSWRSYALSEAQTKAILGDLRQTIDRDIKAAKAKCLVAGTDFSRFKTDKRAGTEAGFNSLSVADKEEYRRLERLGKVAYVEYLGAYEVACGQYLDGAVPSVRFEKLYKNPIREVVENKGVGDVGDFSLPDVQRKYPALYRTYQKFYPIEG